MSGAMMSGVARRPGLAWLSCASQMNRPAFLLLASLVSSEVFADTTEPVAPNAASTPVPVLESSSLGANVEQQSGVDVTSRPWARPEDVNAKQGDTLEVQKVPTKAVKTVKLQNVVPPIHFGSAEADIPEGYTKLLRDVLARMQGRNNVRLHFVGYADNVPLIGEALAKYGSNQVLSRERAGTVAEYFQKALELPPESISYEGMGEAQPVASNATEAGKALNRRVEVEVWYDEVSDKLVDKEVVIPEQINRVKVCRMETVCKLRYKEGQAKRARIKNLIAPLYFDDDATNIPPDFAQKIHQALLDMSGKQGVVVKFIGYTDNAPLVGREERIYGTQVGLSKARARRVALAVQDALKLPAKAIEVDGRGAERPITSNDTERGRALNRRVEVEFWYDDALQELPDEPQICPEAAGAETVTRTYVPPSGNIPPILFEQGKPVIPVGYSDRLRNLMAEVRDKANVRLRFIGYTSNERLDRRTAMVYGDDIGLSSARARRAMQVVKKELGLTNTQAEFEGRGDVQSEDVVNTGFVTSDVSRVDVEVVYDELALLDDNDSLDITRLTRPVIPKDPLALNTMRITVDGKPLDDPNKSVADIQRCTDVALEKANIQFKADNLDLKPRLNVTAWPNTLRYRDNMDAQDSDNRVLFRTYTNYASLIDKSEIRIFDATQSTRDVPLAVVPVNPDHATEWLADFARNKAPARELKYVLRVVDKEGHFDETQPQSLWVVDELTASTKDADIAKEQLVGYGENRLGPEGIAKQGGTIKVYGDRIPEHHTVWVAGRAVPVDKDGKFVVEEILPQGKQTVEVAVLNQSGNGELFWRDLDLKRSDWFYVGIADATLAKDHTVGPARLVTQDTTHYNNELNVDGRLAFYTHGKFGDGWGLTASADTLEGPTKDLFSNFMDKTPDALFRRIDPNYYYPTYGDDGTVEDGAPTLGKFYIKLKKGLSYGLWGNFKIGYGDNDLARVDRGLYGANLHYQTPATTPFGEQRFLFDGFAAEPGTIGGRDEYLGTGGSLYFLRHQDILTGSERVRIEIRDKASGIVVGVKNLTPVLDYDIDYLQGRIVLTQPLSSTAPDNLLVASDTVGGNPQYMVVGYEYTPGFSNTSTLAVGGRSHWWVNDYVKVGVTADRNEEADNKSRLGATDLTLRMSAESWVKIAQSSSEGPGIGALASNDGGFNFTPIGQLSGTNVSAGAARVDTSLGFTDIFPGAKGRLTFYTQSLDAGYSAPGLLTTTDTQQQGGSVVMPVTQRISLNAKMDKTTRVLGLNTSASEMDVGYQLTDHWLLGTGYRKDNRQDDSPIVPLTQVQGDRTDAVLRATYDSLARWSAYGFTQSTLSTTGNREDNSRVGAGGGYRVTDRFKVNGEVSSGNLGAAGRLGTEYLYTDRTTTYLTYALENESADNGVRAKRGNLISGFKTRYSDSASVYVEEKYSHGDVPTGLTHSAGVDLAPVDRWNFGASMDVGSLRDSLTGARIERNGTGLHLGYGFDTIKFSSAIEYLVDSTQNPDLSVTQRKSWLTKNNLKYQATPAWRIIGKLNHSESQSSQGSFYDGNYTEAVLGYGYRPVTNDRLNTLIKYTYFYNLPTTDQVSTANVAVGFVQKSHIASIDVVYDLTQSWSLGAKYAYRLGQVSLDRVNPQFFDSRAQLTIVRVDWQFIRRWDATLEARRLDLIDAQDARSGFLLALYRHVGNNVKAGIGYNFTDFSDNLTDLSYTSQGVFINVLGKI